MSLFIELSTYRPIRLSAITLLATKPSFTSNSNRPRDWTLCRSEEHTSELQSRFDLVCRLLLESFDILLIFSFLSRRSSDLVVILRFFQLKSDIISLRFVHLYVIIHRALDI